MKNNSGMYSGYNLMKLTENERDLANRLCQKGWDGKKVDPAKLKSHENKVLLKLLNKAGKYKKKTAEIEEIEEV